MYFLGIIDVLERYSMRWQAQRAILNFGYHLLLRGPAALGISALTPADYAERFVTFMLHEVLHLPQASPHTGLPMLQAGSYERWGALWKRRRRGLVKERIEGERSDHLRRIAEYEAELRQLRALVAATAPAPSTPAS